MAAHGLHVDQRHSGELLRNFVFKPMLTVNAGTWRDVYPISRLRRILHDYQQILGPVFRLRHGLELRFSVVCCPTLGDHHRWNNGAILDGQSTHRSLDQYILGLNW
jgi:hypothetical protein